jgi:hypothetical protein
MLTSLHKKHFCLGRGQVGVFLIDYVYHYYHNVQEEQQLGPVLLASEYAASVSISIYQPYHKLITGEKSMVNVLIKGSNMSQLKRRYTVKKG